MNRWPKYNFIDDLSVLAESHTRFSVCKTQTPRMSASKAQIGLNIPLQVEISTVFEYITSSQYGTIHEKAARTALICSVTSCHYNILNLLWSDITHPSRRVLNKHNGHFLYENKEVDYPLLRVSISEFFAIESVTAQLYIVSTTLNLGHWLVDACIGRSP